MLIVGGALVLLFLLLSASGHQAALGRERAAHTVLGAIGVGAMVVVLMRMGLPWLAAGVGALWYATRRVGAARGARGGARSSGSAPAPGVARMTRAEAYEVLGLSPGASKEQVLAEYRRLMKKVHPDLGGTTYLATRLNEAKDTLLSG